MGNISRRKGFNKTEAFASMRLKLVLWLSVGLALSSIPALLAGRDRTAGNPDPFQIKLTEDEKILHALNRLTFGPQPGDVERVRKMGLKKWMDQQLHPEHMGENPELEAKLEPLDTLRMTGEALMESYPPPTLIRQYADGKFPLPDDPNLRALAEHLVERYKARQQAKGAKGANGAEDEKGTPAEIQKRADGYQKRLAAATPEERRRMLRWSTPQQAVVTDLWQGKIYRALLSDHQLAEILDDFWFNHFNVFVDKAPATRYSLAQYEREAIRPNVLGKFRDLLEATAKSPAMLFYLDNWQSVGPKSYLGDRPSGPKNKKRGLNENYGRELMELHTLGVNGGYTQKDVIEVARCFTGWTLRMQMKGGGFFYNERMHDPGEKIVLGQKIAAGGMEDGERVLDVLARQPATARHIAYELAQRFVADNPPQALVDRMAKTFLDTDGDLREVMKTMFAAPEFWSQGAYLTKVKTPFETAVSAVRSLDAEVDDAFVLSNRVAALGEPLYRKQEPTGYSNAGTDWMNSGALLARLNFALALAQNHIPGVAVDMARLGPEEKSDANQMARALLLRQPSSQTLEAVDKAMAEQSAKTPEEQRRYLAGLIVGSPDFQRH